MANQDRAWAETTGRMPGCGLARKTKTLSHLIDRLIQEFSCVILPLLFRSGEMFA